MVKDKDTILVVEDDSFARKSMVSFLRQSGFLALEAPNGAEGLILFKSEKPDLMLLDIRMPVMDGLQVLEEISEELSEFPTIIISGVGTIDDVINALKFGAWDYLTKPIVNLSALLHAVNKALERRNLILENRHYQTHLEEEVKKRTEKLALSEQSLKSTLAGIIEVIAKIVEMRDPYTAGHQERVHSLAGRIAEKLHIADDIKEGLDRASIIHDLGKVAIPSEILSKPGRLTAIEDQLIQTHAQIGHDMLSLEHCDFPWPLAEIVQQHHERIDGSGYPSGLKGEEILYEAKILAVADVVEAMAMHRPYREALGIEIALSEIRQNRGTLYDPEVVDACLSLFLDDAYSFTQVAGH
jgi:putative two-component system response regulator